MPGLPHSPGVKSRATGSCRCNSRPVRGRCLRRPGRQPGPRQGGGAFLRGSSGSGRPLQGLLLSAWRLWQGLQDLQAAYVRLQDAAGRHSGLSVNFLPVRRIAQGVRFPSRVRQPERERFFRGHTGRLRGWRMMTRGAQRRVMRECGVSHIPGRSLPGYQRLV
ncbi:MAG: hypothetical protein BWY20_02424 [Spirochaetes bacterium ADurb.Bin215]|nr:MAG: hypothetical protein BWY20_02424 [Spirochaetes bacterium ADurb.Bin215]